MPCVFSRCVAVAAVTAVSPSLGQGSLLQDLKNLAFPASGGSADAALAQAAQEKLHEQQASTVSDPALLQAQAQQILIRQQQQQLAQQQELLAQQQIILQQQMAQGQQVPQQQATSQEDIVIPTTIPEYQYYLESVADMDLLCLGNNTGNVAQSWFTTSQKLRYILGVESAFKPLSKEHALEPALLSILEDMGGQVSGGMPGGVNLLGDDYCGVGKLMTQMLSVLNVDGGGDGSVIYDQLIKNERIMSPLLTLTLDVPWMSYQPHWPMAGLIAQIALRRTSGGGPNAVNSLEIDGLAGTELQQYSTALNAAIIEGNVDVMRELSQVFLDAGVEAVGMSPIGFLCAIFTRAVVADVVTPTMVEASQQPGGKPVPSQAEAMEEARQLFFEGQKVMKKLISSAEEFDITLKTRWPLWGMIYLASLKIG